VLRECDFCRKTYDAKTKRSKFCSDRCRYLSFKGYDRSYRGRRTSWIMQDGAEVRKPPAKLDEKAVARAVVEVKGAAATLDAASTRGPIGMRDACGRLAAAILADIREVGL
jgi:hypothetical protein